MREVVGEFDILLVMSVNPGFGGQSFIPRSIDKVAAARALLDGRGSAADIEVDGGVDHDERRARSCRPARRFWWPAPSIFGAPDPAGGHAARCARPR